MIISIVIMILKENWKCWILINSDSDLNIICQNLMKKWRINSVKKSQRHPSIINEEKLFNYNIHNLKMHIYNHDKWMNVYYEFFYTAEILEVNVILSYSWLHAVNFEIDWKKQA